jgi:hypothetical protein
MKQFNTEDFNKHTEHTQQNVSDQKTQKYNDPRIISKRNQTKEKINLIREGLKNK